MTSATQREAIGVLAELCDLERDIRLGQLMSFLGELTCDQFDEALHDIDDDRLLAAMKIHRDNLRARSAGTVAPTVDLPQTSSISTHITG